MDRLEFLNKKRRETEERMDTLWAPIYDENWGAVIAPAHRRCFEHYLSLCPPGAHLLDAACGTGKYWPLVLASGRTVAGIDQSQGMLARARAKFPGVPAEKLGLQELAYDAAFYGASCMDAMEVIFPEDWPRVLANLRRALKPGGYCYFTVELAAEADIARDFAAGQALGLPVVYGESAHQGGYHYYPALAQVKNWMEAAGFMLVEESTGDEYEHYVVQK